MVRVFGHGLGGVDVTIKAPDLLPPIFMEDLGQDAIVRLTVLHLADTIHREVGQAPFHPFAYALTIFHDRPYDQIPALLQAEFFYEVLENDRCNRANRVMATSTS
jgi:hypothetical protein